MVWETQVGPGPMDSTGQQVINYTLSSILGGKQVYTSSVEETTLCV